MIEVIHGDCTEVLPTLDAGSIDLIPTSPPYNLRIDYGSYKDDLPYQDYLAWTSRWLAQAARVLAPDGSLFVVVADYPRNLSLSDDVSSVARSQGLILQNKIAWAKSIHVKGRTHGHHRPTSSPRYLEVTHETIFHLTKGGSVSLDRHAPGVGVPYAVKANETRYKHRNKLRCGGTVWHIPQPTITGGRKTWGHPATFPVALATRCIRLHGVRDGLRVLDPFGGVGSVGVACKRLALDCTLIEIDETYVATARRRISEASAKVQATWF